MSRLTYPKHLLVLSAAVAGLSGCGGRIEEVRVADPQAVPMATAIEPAAGDWPWWRGATITNIATDASPPISWSSTENIAWRAEVPGEGHGSPILWRDRLFLTTADESAETQSLLCYARDSGDRLWATTVHSGGFMHKHNKNSHASSTPASDGHLVFTAFMVQDGVWVTAVDFNGEIAWQTKAGDFRSMHGYGSSPVIFESLVIVAGDTSAGGFLAALHRETGEIVWRIARGNRPSFATPVVADVAGRSQLLLSGQDEVVSYDPHTGDVLWRSEGPASTTANSIAWNDDLIFTSGGYPQRNVLAIRADGSGSVVWRQSWKVYVPSPVVVGDRLVLIQDNGVARCVACATGEELWTERLGGDFSSSPVLAGDRLYAANEAGTTFVFQAAPEFRSLSENRLPGRIFATLAVGGDALFVRTTDGLFKISE